MQRCTPSLAKPILGLGLICSFLGTAAQAGPAVLKQTEAELRKKQIEDIRYTLDLDLPEDDSPFQGTVTMDFTFHPQKQPLRVDFAKGTVKLVRVNGKTVDFKADDMALSLGEELFQADAKNQLEIQYSHAYSKDGTGLYWFRDPVDQQAYVYTNFEPFSANSFFPCFDQPDLKASYQLNVKVPKAWTVVSAVREKKVTPVGERSSWEFPETKKFSTYLFSLHAGPYRIWEDKKFKVPLRIMARQSLAQYMPVEQWFRATRLGFEFFNRYLGYDYPFGKYDQVVVPDFNSGAMENVAAVTFSERFLVRGQRTEADEQGLEGTILHEMAHMWAGDLVTMSWWNDLWLNESFATYAATLAMASDSRFPNTWLGFLRSKNGAYYADQLVTTHPIVADVPDTEAASTNFDSITYGKGAAFLKQLHFLLGDRIFQKGLQTYFNKHAFGNARVEDFLLAMETASRRKLDTFAKDWLHTAGVNTLTADFSCKNGKIDQFQLQQGVATAEQPTLREHKTQLGLYKWKKPRFEWLHETPLTYQGASTVWAKGKGVPCPDLVLPNNNDHDYVRVILDPISYKNATAHLQGMLNPMHRVMVWQAVADMVLDTKISIKEFSRFVAQQLPLDRHYEVLRVIDARVSQDLLSYIDWIPNDGTKQEILNELVKAYEEVLEGPLPADTKKMQWQTYRELLTLANRSDKLLSVWQGKTVYPKLTLDQDDRWSLLEALSELGYKDSLSLADAEKVKDPSSLGQRRYLEVKAAFPDYEQKLKMLEPIVKGERTLSGQERYAVLSHIFPRSQRELLKRYEATYRKEVDTILNNAELGIARAYITNLLPVSCDKTALPLIDELLAKSYPQSIQERLQVARQNTERCQKVITRLLSETQG